MNEELVSNGCHVKGAAIHQTFTCPDAAHAEKDLHYFLAPSFAVKKIARHNSKELIGSRCLNRDSGAFG